MRLVDLELTSECATKPTTLTQFRLKELVHYNPLTGLFTWRESRVGVSKGSLAGSLEKNGYIRIRIDYVKYNASRLAFLYMTGKLPEMLVDHRDRNRSNNIWLNLRPATYQENMRNRKLSKHNTSGFAGVSWDSGKLKWRARGVIDSKKVCLGYHATPELASEAYQSFTTEHFGNFTGETQCQPI